MAETADIFLHNGFPAHMLEAKEPIVETFRAMLLATDRQGLAGSYAAVRDMDQRRTIALITRPTLVIASQYDTVTAASHGEQIAATVPGAKLVVLPAVHLSNIEYPAEFLRAACQGNQPWLCHAPPPANLLDIMPPALNRSEHP